MVSFTNPDKPPQKQPSAKLLQLITDAEQAIKTLLEYPECQALKETRCDCIPREIEYCLDDFRWAKLELYPELFPVLDDDDNDDDNDDLQPLIAA
jgi:hypothetical protein